jgi:hypothetical protein
VKIAVDEAIDQCGTIFNLRDLIEEERARAEDSTDEQQKHIHAQRGSEKQSFSPLI